LAEFYELPPKPDQSNDFQKWKRFKRIKLIVQETNIYSKGINPW